MSTLKEWLRIYRFYVLMVLFAIGSAGYYYFVLPTEQENSSLNPQEKIPNENVTTTVSEIESVQQVSKIMMADIKGAVNSPGVYKVETGERVIDLVEKAGGLTEDADHSQVNFAMYVEDQMVVYIPKIGEESEISPGITQPVTTTDSSKMNINKAGVDELDELPGIGPAKAETIIEYRDTNGPFKTIEDLKSISGIGEKTFDKLKDLITVK